MESGEVNTTQRHYFRPPHTADFDRYQHEHRSALMSLGAQLLDLADQFIGLPVRQDSIPLGRVVEAARLVLLEKTYRVDPPETLDKRVKSPASQFRRFQQCMTHPNTSEASPTTPTTRTRKASPACFADFNNLSSHVAKKSAPTAQSE
jgi:hypothetical protein